MKHGKTLTRLTDALRALIDGHTLMRADGALAKLEDDLHKVKEDGEWRERSSLARMLPATVYDPPKAETTELLVNIYRNDAGTLLVLDEGAPEQGQDQLIAQKKLRIDFYAGEGIESDSGDYRDLAVNRPTHDGVHADDQKVIDAGLMEILDEDTDEYNSGQSNKPPNISKSNTKYVFTGESKEWQHRRVWRIRRTFDGILGGWIESEENLSYRGSAWVGAEAVVCDQGRVSGNANVSGNARVYDNAQVFDWGYVSDDAEICDLVEVSGGGIVGDTKLTGTAKIESGSYNHGTYGESLVSAENQKYLFSGKKKIIDGTTVRQICRKNDGAAGGWIESEYNLSVHGDCWVDHDAVVYGYSRVEGDAKVYNEAHVYGYARINGCASVYGNARICDDGCVRDAAEVCGEAKVYGNGLVDKERKVSGRTNIDGDNGDIALDSTPTDRKDPQSRAGIFAGLIATPAQVFIPGTIEITPSPPSDEELQGYDEHEDL